MANEYEQELFDRADAFIDLANSQCRSVDPGKVSASFMYAMARFSAWISANSSASAEEMAEHREEAIGYFTAQFQKMLGENLDDYIGRFDEYLHPKKG